MMEEAERQGIRIFLDPRLIGTGTMGSFSAEKKHIRLSPDHPVGDIVPTLVHELRHFWQRSVLGEGDYHFDRTAREALIVSRTLEADAYAFSQTAVRWINGQTNLILETAGKAPHLESVEAINAFARKKYEEMRQSARAPAREEFIRALKELSNYDKDTISHYKSNYASLYFRPRQHKQQKQGVVSRLRHILRFGILEADGNYMEGLSDRAFSDIVLRPVDPRVRNAVKMMDAFETASGAKKLSVNESKEWRRKIETQVKKAMSGPSPRRG